MNSCAMMLSMVTQIPCSDNPELWFSDNKQDKSLAISICNTCPIKTKCLTLATEGKETFGVWGGENFSSNGIKEPDIKLCRAKKHSWIEGQKTCKPCRKESRDRYASKITRVYKPGKLRPRIHVLGGTCINNHSLTGDNVTIRNNDKAILCKKCISGQKTRDMKASSTRKVYSWQ
jgi:WhiB family redox-sensing transcriptional regulator